MFDGLEVIAKIVSTKIGGRPAIAKVRRYCQGPLYPRFVIAKEVESLNISESAFYDILNTFLNWSFLLNFCMFCFFRISIFW